MQENKGQKLQTTINDLIKVTASVTQKDYKPTEHKIA